MTIADTSLPAKRGDSGLPTISIVTPSFNQGQFIRQTIESVLYQDYPSLEYWVIDGGSTDNTLSILAEYESDPRFHWLSEPDQGQTDAINKGFLRSTGEILGWINSDDLYCPGALRFCGEHFRDHPSTDVLYGSVYFIDQFGQRVGELRHAPFDFDYLVRVGIDMHQQGMFWRREVFFNISMLDPSLQFSMDFDMFVKMGRLGLNFARTSQFLGCFRIHDQAKSSLISSVGIVEHKRILEKTLASDQSRPSFATNPCILRAKRALWFAMNGEWRYLARGLARRLRHREY